MSNAYNVNNVNTQSRLLQYTKIMKEEKITKRVLYVTEVTAKEGRVLERLRRTTGASKSSVMRALARKGLASLSKDIWHDSRAQVELNKLGRL